MIRALLLSKQLTLPAYAQLMQWLTKPMDQVRVLFCANATDQASDEEEPAYVAYSRRELRNYGFMTEELDFRDYTSFAGELHGRLVSADMCYFAGGMYHHLMSYFHELDMVKQYVSLLEGGLIHVGASAGAVVCSPEMHYYHYFDNEGESPQEAQSGLGIFPHYISPHYGRPEKPKYSLAYQRMLQEYYPDILPIALLDHQAVIVEGNTRSLCT